MIPKEIDELMWTIAEAGDPHAISEFGERYPNMREELLKRMKTVQALKAGSRTIKAKAVPTFRNTRVRPTNWRLIFATFAATVLVVSSFGVWRLTHSSKPAVQVPAVNVEPVKMPDVNMEVNPPRGNPLPQTGPRTEEPLANPPVVTNPGSLIEPGRTSLKLESASLHAAITMIADAAHWRVTIGSGTPDPTVRIDFQDMTPMEMLKELGKEYAFDTLMDGDHAILILPKKDEDEDQMTNETR